MIHFLRGPQIKIFNNTQLIKYFLIKNNCKNKIILYEKKTPNFKRLCRTLVGRT